MDKKVAEYINKQKSPQKEICLALKKIIFKTLPGVKEEMRWGAIVYEGGKFYIAGVRYGVNLGFAINGLSRKEISLFEGNGKSMRHIKIQTFQEINEETLTKLILMVHKKAFCKPCG